MIEFVASDTVGLCHCNLVAWDYNSAMRLPLHQRNESLWKRTEAAVEMKAEMLG
jgi:hypothetical protein